MTVHCPAHPPLHILLAEDNQHDAFLTQEAFQALEPTPQFTVCPDGMEASSDGVEAMEYLHGQVQAGRLLPDIILMDLNMPRMDGFGLLEHLKHDPALRQVPVQVFSTSDSRSDIRRSYQNYANSSTCKPRLFSEYENVVQAVRSFCTQTASLPT